MMSTRILLCLVMALFASSMAMLREEEEKREAPGTPINEIPLQAEQKGKDEEELRNGDEEDREFDDSILSDEDRVDEAPNREKVKSLFLQQKNRIIAEASRAGEGDLVKRECEIADVNPYFKYYLASDWYIRYYRCCPQSQNYGCRSYRRPMPCFSRYVNGAREWCCPIWPGFPTLYAANCNCSKCLIMTPTCFTEGRCRRRYTRKSFLAVCHRSGWWSYITRVTRRIPTSCYCRANYYLQAAVDFVSPA